LLEGVFAVVPSKRSPAMAEARVEASGKSFNVISPVLERLSALSLNKRFSGFFEIP
jgi:hypothetical protein